MASSNTAQASTAPLLWSHRLVPRSQRGARAHQLSPVPIRWRARRLGSAAERARSVETAIALGCSGQIGLCRSCPLCRRRHGIHWRGCSSARKLHSRRCWQESTGGGSGACALAFAALLPPWLTTASVVAGGSASPNTRQSSNLGRSTLDRVPKSPGILRG